MSDYPTILYDCCERLLAVAGASLTDPPDRVFIADGDPTSLYADCRYLAVSMAPTGMFRSINTRARGNSLPGRPTMKTAVPQATFQVTLISTVCWPTQTDQGEMPDPADITAASLQVLTDRRELWAGLWDATSDGTLFTNILAGKDCASLGEQPATAFGPGGLNAGSKLYVYADLIVDPTAS